MTDDRHKLYQQALDLAYREDEAETREEQARLLEAALESGSAQAAYAIANWIQHGIVYESDINRVVKLMKVAKKGGVPSAFFCLGSMHEGGVKRLIKKNERKAFELYLEGALLGDTDCYMEVARCYFYGIGIGEDQKLAKIWRRRGEALGGKFIERDE